MSWHASGSAVSTSLYVQASRCSTPDELKQRQACLADAIDDHLCQGRHAAQLRLHVVGHAGPQRVAHLVGLATALHATATGQVLSSAHVQSKDC